MGLLYYYYYYYRKKRFRWHNVKRLQGHLTNTKQNSTSATQQNEQSIYQIQTAAESLGQTVSSSADAWKTPVKITMWEMRICPPISH